MFNLARPLRTFTALGLLAGSLAYADDQGFVPLFNGKDLSGWVNANCAPDTWSVTNGMIHCTGRPTGALRTDRQYENFILEAEWRHLSSGGNSGVFIWGTPIAAPGVPFLRGIEVQVLDHGYDVPGKNQWYTTHGDVFPIHGASMDPFGRHNGQRSFPSEERSNPSPQWNHYRIHCENGTLRLTVNGKEVSGGANCNYRKGYLALESEGAPVQFRNVRIKELPSSNTPEALTAPLDIGFRSIFTGLNLEGWQKPADGSGWSVQGERLTWDASKSTTPAALWSEKSYANFELSIDAKLRTAPAPSSAASPLQIWIRHGNTQGLSIPVPEVTSNAHGRFVLKVQNSQATLSLNGKELRTITLPASTPTTGQIGLQGSSASLEFMNLYTRPLP